MAEYVYLQVGSIKIKKLFDGEDNFLGRWQIIFVVLYSKLFKIREEAPQLCDFCSGVGIWFPNMNLFEWLWALCIQTFYDCTRRMERLFICGENVLSGLNTYSSWNSGIHQGPCKDKQFSEIIKIVQERYILHCRKRRTCELISQCAFEPMCSGGSELCVVWMLSRMCCCEMGPCAAEKILHVII